MKIAKSICISLPFHFIIFLPYFGFKSKEKTNFVSDKLFKYGRELREGLRKGSRFSAGENGENFTSGSLKMPFPTKLKNFYWITYEIIKIVSWFFYQR